MRAALNRDFVKPGILPLEIGAFYNALFETRQESDYEDFYESDPEMLHSWLLEAEVFTNRIEDIVFVE